MKNPSRVQRKAARRALRALARRRFRGRAYVVRVVDHVSYTIPNGFSIPRLGIIGIRRRAVDPQVAPGQVWESLDVRAPRMVRVAAIVTDDDGLGTQWAWVEDLISGRMTKLPVQQFNGAVKGFKFYENLPTKK